MPSVPGQTPFPDADLGVEAVSELQPLAIRTTYFAVGFAVVTLIGWYVVEPSVSRAVRRSNENNPTLREAVSRYLRLAFAVLGAAVGLAMAGYGGVLGSSALVVAALTLAVGVAGQSVFGSIISGLVLVFDPEFNVGNYIQWSGGEGKVVSIALRITRVRTPDGGLVTIPNTKLTGDSITRPYAGGPHRVTQHVGIDYEDDTGRARASMEAAARDLDGVLDDPEPRAYVDELGSDSVVVGVWYYVEQPREGNLLGIRSSYLTEAKRRLEADGFTVSPASKHELTGGLEVRDTR
ncbi:MAG: mechanosensitive ion channel family protein [Halobacteriota archaeon]